MVTDGSIAQELARHLLKIKAIRIQTSSPFQWASGWYSPIYCDNRKTLSHPNIRNFVKRHLADLINEKYPDVEVIAGVATGAIAIGALVADILDKPFLYIRSSSKSHGLGNQIEGDLNTGKKVVVVEDLVSTGMSSLKAVDCLREAEKDVLGMVSIFTYAFDITTDNFNKSGCELHSLGDYHHLLEAALEYDYIVKEEIETLKEWRNNPSNWRQS